jgi:hypothetical protein
MSNNRSPLLEALSKVAGGSSSTDTRTGLYTNCGSQSQCSSSSSIGLDADVVPVRVSPTLAGSPRLTYLRTLSGRMVNAGLAPLEPPLDHLRNRVPSMPLAPVSSVLPEPGDQSKASSAGIIFTLWNTMMGSTLLVMPYTFQQAGWLLALVLSVVCAVVSQGTCSLILQYAEGMMITDPSAEFADLAQQHFGQVGRLLAFLTGNIVVLGAAVAMHGYMATVLSQLIRLPPAHGGFCTADAHAGVNGTSVVGGLPPQHESPCLAPLLHAWPPVTATAPAPILVLAVLVVTFPLVRDVT